MFYVLTFILVLFSCVAQAGSCDFIQFGECGSCDDPYSFLVGSTESCAYLCPNREVNYNGSGSSVVARNCALKECPAEYPFQSEYGDCYKTLEEADLNMGRPYERVSMPDYSSEKISLPSDGLCPQPFPMQDYKKCYSCAYPNDLHISESECQKCPNRIYKYYPRRDLQICEKPCPPDKPVKQWDGTCFACDTPGIIGTPSHCNLERDCEVCPNRTIRYQPGGNAPSVPNCPPDKPLMDSEGICFACDTPVPVGLEWGNQKNCEHACPKTRHLYGNECVLNT